ncbi:hypothetical protein [Sphaerisporangium perillae]|uniref:hypothetical protein n=1 Tax=Sphaerisporangium perillae TaxID=2935860 RepID=UPI00200F6360|nr:hypothetical protein [Sphaerisporangium perillae]
MAELLPLHDDRPGDYAEAIEAYLLSAGISTSSHRIYRISLMTWAWLATGEQPPLGLDPLRRRKVIPP